MAIGTAAAILGGAAIGGLTSIFGGNKAAKAQEQASRDANSVAAETRDKELALQEKMFNKNIELQQPTIDAGNTSRNRLMQLLGLSVGGADNGSLMRDFSMADFQSDPGYQFRMDQGQQALERSAAARGGLLSGAALRDTARFSQGLASQDYQAAFDRFQSNRTNKLNPLLSLAGSAQTASGALGAAGQNYASGASQTLGNFGATAGANLMGAGNARASGYVNTANAINGGIGQAVNGMQQSSMLEKMQEQNRLLSLLKSPASGGSTTLTSPATPAQAWDKVTSGWNSGTGY